MSNSLELVAVYFDGQEMKIENIHIYIFKKINEHDRVVIKGDVKAENYDHYIEKASSETDIEIKFKDDNKGLLNFSGILNEITDIAEGVEHNAVYHMIIKSQAYTKQMDVKQINRSFQHECETYDERIDSILEKYPGADWKNEACTGEQTNDFRLQKWETDYKFILRLASLKNACVICDSRHKVPKFYFGKEEHPDKGELEKYNYKVIKDIAKYRLMTENKWHYRQWIGELSEIDCIRYKIMLREDEEALDIGDKVVYKGMSLYVNESQTEVRDHKKYCIYYLGSKNSLKCPEFYNEKITGLSLIGQVIDVKDNHLKLWLDIDRNDGRDQPIENAKWFEYRTSYATKYCMPEINDYVNLFFPRNDEMDAIGLDSIKQNPEGGYMRNNELPEYPLGNNSQILPFVRSAHDPDVKMITTKPGRSLAFCEDCIKIVFDDDTYVVLHDNEGIALYTKNNIRIQADKNIQMTAKKQIKIKAKERVLLNSGASVIDVKPKIIKVKSDDVDMN